MKKLQDLRDELECLANQLIVLCNVATDDYTEHCDRISGSVLQNAIYSVAQHITRIYSDLEEINRR